MLHLRWYRKISPTFPCEREGSCLVGVLGMLQA
jgi:hypothetical protein